MDFETCKFTKRDKLVSPDTLYVKIFSSMHLQKSPMIPCWIIFFVKAMNGFLCELNIHQPCILGKMNFLIATKKSLLLSGHLIRRFLVMNLRLGTLPFLELILNWIV